MILPYHSSYITQSNWSRERLLRIESGYYDPLDNGAARRCPWTIWLLLLIVFVLLVGWAFYYRRDGQK